MKQFLIIVLFLSYILTGLAQTSDNQYQRPLRDVLKEIEARFNVKLRISEKDVEGKVLTYAEWRMRPNLEKTLTNVLAPFDLVFQPDGAPNKFKLQGFQYHVRSKEDAKEILDHLAGLYSNKAQWEARRDSMKPCILKALRLSPIPASPGTPPIFTPIRKMNGYTVRNIAFEVLPGVYSCGSLYQPENIKGKIPVILCPIGHFPNGRYHEQIQSRCAALARMGAMAITYDLFAWQESGLQFDGKYHRSSLANTMQALSSLRILDYLLSLKEADTTRVGITGASGGGSHSMLIGAIDPRIKVSVPTVMMSAIHYGGCPCESGNPIHLCGGGTNNVELAAMFAPKPMLILSDGGDWTTNVPELEFPYLKRIYDFYEAPVENTHFPNEGHDYGPSKRAAMYRFMAKHLGLDASKVFKPNGELDESTISIEPMNVLKVFGDNGEKLPANAIRSFHDLEKLFGMEPSYDQSKYKIGVCDWMILKRQKLGAFQRASEIGADGVLLDMGGLGNRPTFDSKLMDPVERSKFQAAQKKYKLEIAGIAMSGFYAQNLAERNIGPMIDDCINTMQLMGTKVAFLPLGNEGDLVKHPERRDSIVARLRMAGQKAEAADVVIGIETALDAAGEIKLLDEIGSPAIKIYFNLANALKNGREVYSELKTLGKERICQIMCSNKDSVWLENDPQIDLRRLKATLDEMKYEGWLVIERSRDATRTKADDVVWNYGANARYLKSVFQ